jgi:hypothetical protein
LGLFISKSGVFADTNVLHRSVANVANLEGPEEERVAEDSPISDCLPGLSFGGQRRQYTCFQSNVV